MNILELVIGELNQKKNLLEAELERVVNNKDLTIPNKVDMSKNLLLEITNVLTTINLTNGYLSPLDTSRENNK